VPHLLFFHHTDEIEKAFDQEEQTNVMHRPVTKKSMTIADKKIEHSRIPRLPANADGQGSHQVI
jgi:hypothetical protein